MEDDAEDEGEGEEDDERPRDVRAGHVTEADLGERIREVAHAARPEDDQGQAAEERQCPEGHDQRRQTAARDKQAVQQAAEDADHEDDRDVDLHRDAGGPQEAEESAR